MNENYFRFSALIVILAALTISIHFRRKADRDSGAKVSWKDEGLAMFLALRLGGLVLWGSAFAYLVNPAWMAWAALELPDWSRWLGFGLGLICDGLLFWLFNSLGRGISPTVATRPDHQLVTSGPYRWVRHPLYTVGSALFLAFAMMAANWFIALLAALAFGLLALRLPNEEAHLIEKFGQAYRAYMRRTGRFLPRIGSSL